MIGPVWFIIVICGVFVAKELMDMLTEWRNEVLMGRLFEGINVPAIRHFVTVRSDVDPAYRQEIEVTNNIGTSNYIRFLDGLLCKVDANLGYWVDHFDADMEHHKMRQLVAA